MHRIKVILIIDVETEHLLPGKVDPNVKIVEESSPSTDTEILYVENASRLDSCVDVDRLVILSSSYSIKISSGQASRRIKS